VLVAALPGGFERHSYGGKLRPIYSVNARWVLVIGFKVAAIYSHGYRGLPCVLVGWWYVHRSSDTWLSAPFVCEGTSVRVDEVAPIMTQRWCRCALAECSYGKF
jgi:hypothetical protein